MTKREKEEVEKLRKQNSELRSRVEELVKRLGETSRRADQKEKWNPFEYSRVTGIKNDDY